MISKFQNTLKNSGMLSLVVSIVFFVSMLISVYLLYLLIEPIKKGEEVKGVLEIAGRVQVWTQGNERNQLKSCTKSL